MGNKITRNKTSRRSYRPPPQQLEDDSAHPTTEHTPLKNPSANEGTSNKPSSSTSSTSTSPTNKKKIAIIGAGVSGIICGSVLQENGYEVTLFETSDRVGGVWGSAYPEARLQNTGNQYYHPDFPYPLPGRAPDDDLYPSALQIQDYFQQCAEHFGLNIKLNARVVDLREIIGSSSSTNSRDDNWILTHDENHSTLTRKSEQYSFVIIAHGHYNCEIPLPWNGADKFEMCGGTILQRTQIKDLNIFKDQKVAVIGFGKTAVDMCTFSIDHGASSTTHVFRTPRVLIPEYVGGIHFSWLLFNRFHNYLIPSWGHPSKIWAFLHKTVPCLFIAIWGFIQHISWFFQTRCAIFSSREIRKRVKLLKSKSHILKEHRVATGVCPTNFFPYVSQGKIYPIQGDVQEITSTGLLLKDGRTIEADVILATIGKGDQVDTFPYLPNKYQKMFQQQENCVGGLQLYRHIMHPDVPNLAFMGWNAGFLHCSHVYLASVWLSSMLDGELKLPPKEDQREMCNRMVNWKREHLQYEPNLNSAIHTRILQYNDTLLKDLRLDPYRKSNFIEEIFGRYTPGDYTGVRKEVQERRHWSPISVDM